MSQKLVFNFHLSSDRRRWKWSDTFRTWVFPKIGIRDTRKMDGENNGKPYYSKWDDLLGENPLFSEKKHIVV